MITSCISLTEAAKRLGVTPATAARYIRRQVLPAWWFGRSWFIDPAAVERLLQSGTPKPRRQSKA
jgi:excisionase family DNA binding protein